MSSRAPIAMALMLLSLTSCYTGDYLQGLQCEVSTDCGPGLDCIQGFCGSEPPPPAPEATWLVWERRNFQFNWPAIERADFYRLIEQRFPWEEPVELEFPLAEALLPPANPDDPPIVHFSIDYRASLPLRSRALYEVLACNPFGCASSEPIEVIGRLQDAVITTTRDQHLGHAIALDGNTMVAADGLGFVHMYEWMDDEWSYEDTFNLEGYPESGSSPSPVSLSLHGFDIFVGMPEAADGAGTVLIFRHLTPNSSNPKDILTGAPGSAFGTSIDTECTTDDCILAIGAPGNASATGNPDDTSAPGSGAVHVYYRATLIESETFELAFIKAPNFDDGDAFGSSLALRGDHQLFVGAPGEDSSALGLGGDREDNSAEDAGAVYEFGYDQSDGFWSLTTYIKASNTGAGDRFGGALAASETSLMVGASGEASASTEPNTDPSDDSAPGAGAAYLFGLDPTLGGVSGELHYIKASNAEAGDGFGARLAGTEFGDIWAIAALGENSRALGINGDQANDDDDTHGAVYTFVAHEDPSTGDALGLLDQVAYVKTPSLRANGGFGSGLAFDGEKMVVGAPRAETGGPPGAFHTY